MNFVDAFDWLLKVRRQLVWFAAQAATSLGTELRHAVVMAS